jgi:hypothetical protein
MLPARTGCLTPPRLQSFVGVDAAGGAAGHPVDLKIGPGGDLFYVDMDDGTVTASPTRRQPAADRGDHGEPDQRSRPADGQLRRHRLVRPGGQAAELLVGSQRRRNVRRCDRPDASYTYTTAGVYHPSLRVTDDQGAATRQSVTVTAGNTAPTAVIDSPASSLTWKVGDTINFSGHATDAQDGTLPASALSWSLILHHCFTPTDCHTHLIQTINGVSSGSFTAPDHEYPCWLELQLTATDSAG